MDFLGNSVYGVPLILLVGLWWMTTQLKGSNSSSQSIPKTKFKKIPIPEGKLKCRNCFKIIPIKDHLCPECNYCNDWQSN
jgi:hypothetical protein